MTNLTLLIPMYSQPNFLATTLRGLVRNSRLKNRIVVIWSDPARQDQVCASALDYLADYDMLMKENKLKTYQKYSSIQDYMTRQADFIAENKIEFVDVTEPAYEFMLKYKAGKIWKGNSVKPANTPWEGGQDIAFKDNFGINITDSEYVMPNWDADFYPSPGWDEILLENAQLMPPRSILVPVQMQPLEFDELPQWTNAWEDGRYVACGRITMPIPRRGGNTTTDEELEEFHAKWARAELIKERPGERNYLHHFPVLYRTEELKNIIGPYNYQGSGYDLEIDDRCGHLGFRKLTDRRSWCIHKAYVAVKSEWV